MFEVHACLTALAAQRPLFHSEADFQHALAWHLHTLEPAARVRLEYRPFPAEAIYLDLWVATPTEILALELKYPTRGLSVTVAGEAYALKDQAAQDLTRYDFVKDLALYGAETSSEFARSVPLRRSSGLRSRSARSLQCS